MKLIDQLLAQDLLPDTVLRVGIRRLLRQRLREEAKVNTRGEEKAMEKIVEAMKSSPIAMQTGAANEQHYEVPTQFFRYCLGPRMKYSSAWWGNDQNDLSEAEEAMLKLTAERAELQDGQRILELGCGWGSLTLWMAEKFPAATIVGVSNSRSQKEFIDQRARDLGLTNIQIVTADMNNFETDDHFERVVSIEMFEHMRNWDALLKKISGWLAPEGKFFMHIFTHRSFTYFFENRDASDWMSRYFFTGGMMPSMNLLQEFQQDLCVEADWRVDGTHYARTAEAWLTNMERNKEAIIPLLARTYGAGESTKWWVYWKLFYMACAELWSYKGGNEWLVSHYRLSRP